MDSGRGVFVVPGADVAHASRVVRLHSHEKQTFYGNPLEEGVAWYLVKNRINCLFMRNSIGYNFFFD